MEKPGRLGLVFLSLLSACSSLTPTETPPGIDSSKSPVIICSAPDENNSKAIAMIYFQKNAKNLVEMNLQRFTGSEETKPQPDGGLIPLTDEQTRTGLDIEIPVGKKGDEIVYINLGGCLVEKKDLKRLHDFFQGVKPNDFQNQTGYNGKLKKFEPTVVNPKGQNPFAGIKNLRQL